MSDKSDYLEKAKDLAYMFISVLLLQPAAV